jgi:hypothetical protein
MSVVREVTVRSLSANEVATIRAALRLWIETPAGSISPECFLELAGYGALADPEIEQLLIELTTGGLIVTTYTVVPDPVTKTS